MPRVLLSVRSRADLNELVAWIGRDSPRAAERMIVQIVDRMQLLRRHPLVGHPRNDISPGLRALRCGAWLILYDVTPKRVFVTRIMHHSRDLSSF